MRTIQLSDEMSEKLWKRLQFKTAPEWVYLRNKLFESTGLPGIVRDMRSGKTVIRTKVFNLEPSKQKLCNKCKKIIQNLMDHIMC